MNSDNFHTGQPPDIPASLFALNRTRLLSRLRADPEIVPQGSVVILKGGDYHQRYGTTAEVASFRQESFFYWAFGVTEPGFYGLLDVHSGVSMLFVNRQSEATIRRECRPTLSKLQDTYVVDKIGFTDQIPEDLIELKCRKILILEGPDINGQLISTLSADFEGIAEFDIDREILFEAMSECRVRKTDAEIKIFRYAHKTSSDAHKMVMQRVRPGMFEYQAESLYTHYCTYHGCMSHFGYPPLMGSGHTSAIFHYGRAWVPARKQIQDGDMCVFDMGMEYKCFCTDITTTFPANGKFTADQRLIYNIVLDSQRAVMKAIKPGVWWPDMHTLASRVLLEGLRQAGLVQGDVEKMLEVDLSSVFMKQGVGHQMGLDVTDVGGYKKGDKPVTCGSLTIRTNRVLEEGMVVTVEPSCFFNDYLLDEALSRPDQNHFLCQDNLARFRGTGGAQIEDTVVITSTGAESLVSVPRTVDEIEQWMALGRQTE